MITLFHSFIDHVKHLLVGFTGKKPAPSSVKQDNSCPHDLGHASKCVWELDKEA